MKRWPCLKSKGQNISDPRIVELLFENLPKILAIKEKFKEMSNRSIDVVFLSSRG